MNRFIGLDLHKKVIEFCILGEDGDVIDNGRFPATRADIEHFARKRLSPSSDRLVMEATGNTWPIARLLKPFAAELVVSNPLKTAIIAKANVKTDKVDAAVLAHLLRCNFIPAVWQPDDFTQTLRRLTGRRAARVRDAVRLKNRIHAVLTQNLITHPDLDLFSPRGRAWLTDLPNLPLADRFEIDANLRLLDAVDDETRRLNVVLDQVAWDTDDVRLLMTLPGVDVHVALALLAAFGDPHRFPNGDKAAAYIGLVPKTFQSADKCYHGPITKAGRGHARWMAIQAAQHLETHPGPLGHFFRRKKRAKNHNVAVVAAARKLVALAWLLLVRHEPYRYADPRVTQDKLARLRVRCGGGKRKTGCPKGVRAAAKLAPGVRSRTLPALDDLFAREGLPPTTPPPPGERRVLEETGLLDHVRSLARPRVIRRTLDAGPLPDSAQPGAGR